MSLTYREYQEMLMHKKGREFEGCKFSVGDIVRYTRHDPPFTRERYQNKLFQVVDGLHKSYRLRLLFGEGGTCAWFNEDDLTLLEGKDLEISQQGMDILEHNNSQIELMNKKLIERGVKPQEPIFNAASLAKINYIKELPDGKFEIEWDNRSIYTGDAVCGVPHGNGTMKFSFGFEWSGKFKNGLQVPTSRDSTN